jgi:hypothetical protein
MIQDRVKYKKAVSNLVYIAISITFVLAIAGLIYTLYVQNSVNLFLSPSLNCASLKNSLSIERSCYNSTTGEVKVLLKRNSGDFDKIDFTIAQTNSSSNWVCGEGCHCKIIGIGESKYYFFEANEPNRIQVSASSCLLDDEEIINC